MLLAACTTQGASPIEDTSGGKGGTTPTTAADAVERGQSQGTPATGDVAVRLARLEHRMDQVVNILDQALPPAEPDPSATYSVSIDPADPVQGPANAKVTIVEGFEFLCPYCFMVNPTVDQILAKYPNDVRLVSKYLIIHGAPAVMPGMAACASAKQGKYKEMKAALWSHLFKMEGDRPKMQQDQVSPDAIEKMATEAGLDVTKMKADMTSTECQSWLQTSQDALHPLGANATPAFFINGHYISGAQPFENFDKIIQAELAKADKKIADGVAQADLYQKEVVEKGLKKVKGHFDD
jgi:protein-disulfide isomerase